MNNLITFLCCLALALSFASACSPAGCAPPQSRPANNLMRRIFPERLGAPIVASEMPAPVVPLDRVAEVDELVVHPPHKLTRREQKQERLLKNLEKLTKPKFKSMFGLSPEEAIRIFDSEPDNLNPRERMLRRLMHNSPAAGTLREMSKLRRDIVEREKKLEERTRLTAVAMQPRSSPPHDKHKPTATEKPSILLAPDTTLTDTPPRPADAGDEVISVGIRPEDADVAVGLSLPDIARRRAAVEEYRVIEELQKQLDEAKEKIAHMRNASASAAPPVPTTARDTPTSPRNPAAPTRGEPASMPVAIPAPEPSAPTATDVDILRAAVAPPTATMSDLRGPTTLPITSPPIAHSAAPASTSSPPVPSPPPPSHPQPSTSAPPPSQPEITYDEPRPERETVSARSVPAPEAMPVAPAARESSAPRAEEVARPPGGEWLRSSRWDDDDDDDERRMARIFF